MKFQQWCPFAYLKNFTFLNLERGADLGRSRLVFQTKCMNCSRGYTIYLASLLLKKTFSLIRNRMYQKVASYFFYIFSSIAKLRYIEEGTLCIFVTFLNQERAHFRFLIFKSSYEKIDF